MAVRPLLMLSLALGAACAITLGACGGDEDVGEIPAESSAVMLAALEDARAAEESDPRECEAIADSASRVANEAAGLPESPVREAVIAAAENLDDLAKSDECGPSTTGPQGPANEDETTTPTTTPTTTATTTEETTTTTTKEKEPAPKPKPQPPGEGNAPPGGTPPGQDGGGPDTGGTGGGGTGAG